MKYTVEMYAYISVTIEAESEQEALLKAEDVVIEGEITAYEVDSQVTLKVEWHVSECMGYEVKDSQGETVECVW